MVLYFFAFCFAYPKREASELIEATINTNMIHRLQESKTSKSNDEMRSLKKVYLSNRFITCNDKSQAGFYLRKSSTSRKWIVFLEGGWYCYDHHTCRNRWLRQRHFMTSSQWPETKDVGGILSPNEYENPYWWNSNHVFIPYCSSDTWSGTRKASRNEMFSFMGASIVQQVVRDLVPLGLENSTELLLVGSSAGGTGVMINLDPVQELLHRVLKLNHITVRGVADSGWFLDRTPYAPKGTPTVDAIRKGMQLWQGKVPKRCRQMYLDEPWRCYFGYRLYPTLKAPLFIFQWLFDEAQMDADNVGAPVTKQQWDYIHKMGDALRQSFENVSAVFAPSCISHSILTKRDWLNLKIDEISFAESLQCWEQRPIKRRMHKKKFMKLYAEESTLGHQKSKISPKMQTYELANVTKDNVTVKYEEENSRLKQLDTNKRRKNKKRKRRRNKRRRDKNQQQNSSANSAANQPLLQTSRSERSVLRSQKHPRSRPCHDRLLERCSWPQCNRSCPRLHNPFTGEEMDFIDLLKSFGLDMENVADALGIDLPTLNNMDHGDLLNMLTQQTN
ncbi:palmitoleoyl-protein carboxylesterase NOTUM isoform X2 [Agrilus planipennis]|uniref:Palmitoleoyl-protein carboxylesterase NOTUM isoform X2 n=1 Tax=Agrilus planipennis TaxID=224129 RepID=A0A1W4XG63_AGRPL|nr:palmitoleoyl-protein carboxylesterase NOTUM isoform X2 [Agrilus planipennis]